MANISLAPDCPARILMLIMKAMSVQKPAHMILKPLNLNGAVSERTHAVRGVKISGANMLANELMPDIQP
jgi:hypothetical protein